MSDTDRGELPWDRPKADPADGDLFAQPLEIPRTGFIRVITDPGERLALARISVGRLLDPDPEDQWARAERRARQLTGRGDDQPIGRGFGVLFPRRGSLNTNT